MVTELTGRYPAIKEHPEDFRDCEALRCVPTLRYPALLRAALTTARNRKARPRPQAIALRRRDSLSSPIRSHGRTTLG
jgi:hypothetical protein